MNLPVLVTGQSFKVWLSNLDDLCRHQLGCSYQDLPDQCFRDWYDDGLTPLAAFHRVIEEDYQSSTYTQEFDDFSDAGPGL